MSWQSIARMLSKAALAALGNDVTIGSTAGYGILRSPEESVMDGMVFVSDYLLELPLDLWGTVAEGTQIEVDGVFYQSREQGRINRDGSSLFVPLTLVRAGQIPGVFTAGVFEDGVFSTDGTTAQTFTAGVFETGVYGA